MTEFVEGWTIVQTLGEGSYGEVKLLTNRNTGSAVAMKTIDLAKHPNVVKAVRKEIIIHKDLSHPNIIGYYGQRQNDTSVYIFLEYASGGELFDRIEPDVGMLPGEAQKFFQQLLSGVEYLHSRGIAHRDLKPENLLLDDSGNLKISDFGMATYFRLDGRERLLENRCGTLPYAAPEVLLNCYAYAAEPVDIWSCGIILVALLAGELPWDQPSNDCEEYKNWKSDKYMQVTPWSKLDTIALSLVRKILVPSPKDRYTIAKIRDHRWYNKRFSDNFTSCDVTDSARESKLCKSQPQDSCNMEITHDSMFDNGYSFSQPTQIDDLLISTQLLLSQPANANTNCVQRLVRRMTRFFVTVNVDQGAACLIEIIEKLGYSWKIFSAGVITISTLDRRKSPLTFKASILDMDGRTLMDFRLSKGCGLEFKRCFIAVRKELNAIIVKGQVSWSCVS
ncbi:serine/threonine-protein kinase grp-like isoform X1 [Planococcus citri]|uniref:serine/threonine-protein kinase grp-like isoform X1 n=1 Tax=Planococcus citri TaxID=170843 RepID=UPI0031F9517B